jgi:uncharacterized membrane protein
MDTLLSLYDFAAKLGYPHPWRPAVTHIPIGLLVGAFVFG